MASSRHHQRVGDGTPTQTGLPSPTFCRLLASESGGQTDLVCARLWQPAPSQGLGGFSARITDRPVQFSTLQPAT